MPDKPHSGKDSSRPRAVALRYDRSRDQAPVVIGKGAGLLAERIIALAREHNIPIHEDADLVEILSLIDLHAEIPPATYAVVAEILAFIYRSNQSFLPK
ncbi:MAG: EscU/YscU/HrcU family type III secretion system export apparatus switch protein [Desulfobacteraceae bacterium]|nr:EscU/YscU/HrcU family type III secretion system export apparatus switch protein [Desulfobacteraceae bacterium]